MAHPPSIPRMNAHLAHRILTKKAQLDGYRPLPAEVMQRLNDDLRVAFTYHSNAIEGNTLTLRETQLVIEYGMTAGGHPLREYLEATNHAGAYGQLLDLVRLQTPITQEVILTLHRVTMAKILDAPGDMRQVPVHIRGAAMTPPAPHLIDRYLREWVQWVNETGREYPTVVRAAVAHHGFEAIHPFVDGNGRVGRLLLNFILMQDGYPPAIIEREWRAEYIAALGAADAGNYRALADLVGRAVEIGLDRFLEACVIMPDDPYQPLAALAPQVGFSANYLGLLIRGRKLHGIKRGKLWYTTLDEIARYKAEVADPEHPQGRPRHELLRLPGDPSAKLDR
ncbi:MAG: Fic family protein [Ktedonobacterales bacterium]|nr:Fic family protein [Ktedonobacterales bacterium]